MLHPSKTCYRGWLWKPLGSSLLHTSAMQWADLMTQLSVQYPDAAAHVICDFLNEPDFGNLRWEAQPDQGLPGMKDMYLNAMDEVYNITSGELHPSAQVPHPL